MPTRKPSYIIFILNCIETNSASITWIREKIGRYCRADMVVKVSNFLYDGMVEHVVTELVSGYMIRVVVYS